jgi:integrase
VENIIDYMVAKKHRAPGPNPASWNGPLSKLLPAPSSVQKVVHHPSVPYAEIPALYARIREVGSVAARALAFTLLTAVRSGEARGARWREFGLEAKTWTIPAERMKMEQPHVVPLTDEVMALLGDVGKSDALVFPGIKPGEPLSDATMLKVLRTITKDDATVHGLRASFRTWAAEATNCPREIAEACLAHRVGDDVERAYARTTFFEKRKTLMKDWTDYASGQKLA